MNTRLRPQDRAPWRWVTLQSGPVVIIDATLGFHFRVAVTEPTVLEPPLNGSSGQPVRIRFDQDATGHAVTLHSAIEGSAAIDDTADTVTFVDLVYDEVTLVWTVKPIGLTQAEADLLYQPLDADLTAIAAVSTDAYGRGFLALNAEVAGRTYIGATAAGSTLLTAADDAAQRTALGLGAAYAANKAAAHADSTAVDVAGIVADYNGLLAKLRTAGLLAT